MKVHAYHIFENFTEYLATLNAVILYLHISHDD